MPRYFTRCRTTTSFNKEKKLEGRRQVKYVLGTDLFKSSGVSIGDSIYVVTNNKGKLYLWGKQVVGKICDIEEAASDLHCKPEDLRGKKNYNECTIASAATLMCFDIMVSLELTRQLRVKRAGGLIKPLLFESPERIDRQTLRNLVELEPVWAAKLDELLPPLQRVSDDSGRALLPQPLIAVATTCDRSRKLYTVSNL